MLGWYVVKSKPRQEAVAIQHLNRQGFECFYPRIEVRKKYRGQFRNIVEALFGGYVFIYLDSSKQDCSKIRSTRGVQDFVRFGHLILPVSKLVINAIQSRMDEENIVRDIKTHFKKGQSVAIEEGPLAGLQAVFDCHRSEERVILFVNLLGRLQAVEVPLSVVA